MLSWKLPAAILVGLVTVSALTAPPAGAQRVPVDFSGGYVFNAPGDTVPFRGAVGVSLGLRTGKFMLGPAASYAVVSASSSLALGGQLDYCLLGCLNDLEVGVTGRVLHSVAGDEMFPASAGVMVTATVLRSGVVVTRDFELDATSLEVVFGIELLSIPELFAALSCDEAVEIC